MTAGLQVSSSLLAASQPLPAAVTAADLTAASAATWDFQQTSMAHLLLALLGFMTNKLAIIGVAISKSDEPAAASKDRR